MGIRVISKGFSHSRMRKSVFRILRESMLCSMATVKGASRAHINTAFFAYSDQLEFYFLSDPRSIHCRNLSTNPSMAMTVFRSSQKWDESGRGLQLFGRCSEAKGSQATRAETMYGKRFPAYAKWTRNRRQASLLRAYRFYRFIPNTAKVMDEEEYGGAVFLVAPVKKLIERD